MPLQQVLSIKQRFIAFVVLTEPKWLPKTSSTKVHSLMQPFNHSLFVLTAWHVLDTASSEHLYSCSPRDNLSSYGAAIAFVLL